MDVKSGQLDVNAMLQQKWVDGRLRWNSSDYGDIKTLAIPASDLWKPDIILYNGIGEEQAFHDDTILLEHTGKLRWIRSLRMQVRCDLNLATFPFDNQTCKFKFGSSIHHMHTLNMTYVNDDVALAFEIEMDESGKYWMLVNHTAGLKVKHYSCCSYQTMVYTVVLERISIYYIHVYILPAVILALLIPFQLFLPPESRERLTLGSILIIANIMMIFKLQDVLPMQHATLSLLDIFYSLNLIWSFLALLATICVLNVHNRGPRRGKVPDIIRSVFLSCLKPIVCLENDNYYPVISTGCVPMKDFASPSGLSTEHDGHRDGKNGSKLETDVEDLNRQVCLLTARARTNEVKEEMLGEWRQVSLVLDRVLFFLFMFTIFIYTVVLLYIVF
ncbi:neuronal acetylcholine receptor subunit alpha-2 isoform X2 [Patella vulgata]|nr:neuronal acetylcholine receptor subunit alpha-2 isoform X2 [Patella vulgata]XP_055954913.1 neuronal acetylcholine receptor subunit alpha-2 isoform X2 [Patella vulgata]